MYMITLCLIIIIILQNLIFARKRTITGSHVIMSVPFECYYYTFVQELEQCKADLLVAQRQQVVALTSSPGTAENVSKDDAAAVDEGTVKIVKSHELTEKDLL